MKKYILPFLVSILSSISFAKQNLIPVIISPKSGVYKYNLKKYSEYKLTVQMQSLGDHPFADKIESETLRQSIMGMRKSFSELIGITDYFIDSLVVNEKSPLKTMITLKGFYRQNGMKHFFAERQIVSEGRLRIFNLDRTSYLRPSEKIFNEVLEEFQGSGRLPASDDTPKIEAGAVCLECLEQGKNIIPKEISDIGKKLNINSCEKIRDDYRSPLVLKGEDFRKNGDEEFLEAVGKGTLSCLSKIGEQLTQGGWDFISFVGMIMKFAYNGVVDVAGSAVSGMSDFAASLFSNDGRRNILQSVKLGYSSGVKRITAGAHYLQTNGIAGVMNASVESVQNSSTLLGKSLGGMFLSWKNKHANYWGCLKGREKFEYFCDWAGSIAGLMIPPAAAFKLIKEGTLAAKSVLIHDKVAEKYLAKANAQHMKGVPSPQLDSLATSAKINPQSVPKEIAKFADQNRRVSNELGQVLAGAHSIPEVQAVVTVAKAAEAGQLQAAVVSAGKNAGAYPKGHGGRLLQAACKCGFPCSTKGPHNMRSMMIPLFLRESQAQEIPTNCIQVAEELQKLIVPIQGLLKDAEVGKTYFYYGRLRNAFEAIPEEKLDALFKKLSPQDFETLFYGTQSGFIKTDRAIVEVIEQLWHLADDVGHDVFWAETDRIFKIKKAMAAIDKSWGFSDEASVAAQFTDRALAQTESEVIARALGETLRGQKYPNSKWYDRITQFFSPHFERVRDILDVNQQIRGSMQIMYKADVPAADALVRYADVLTPAETTTIRAMTTDTAEKLSGIRGLTEELYGKSISLKSPLVESEIRLRELGKRAAALKEKHSVNQQFSEAGVDMDRLAELLEPVWSRKVQQNPELLKSGQVHPERGYLRPTSELAAEELQIQFGNKSAQTKTLSDQYFGITRSNVPARSEYRTEVAWEDVANYSWTEKTGTREVKNAQGEVIGTEDIIEAFSDSKRVPRTMSKTLDASFEEALAGEIIPDINRVSIPSPNVSRPMGVPFHASESLTQTTPGFSWIEEEKLLQILKKSAQARKTEAPYRQQISNAVAETESLSNTHYQDLLKSGDSKSINQFRTSIQQSRDKLVKLRLELIEYRKADAASVNKQWPEDKYEVFLDRNNQMQDRINHMIARIDHVDEQLARKLPSLELEIQQRDHSQPLAELKKVHDRNRKIQVGTGAVSTVAGGSIAAYYMSPTVKEKVNDFAKELGIIKQAEAENDETYKRAWMNEK